MGVPAEQDIETGGRRLAINLGCVRQQDGARTVRDRFGGLLDVVDTKEMRVVDAGKIEPIAALRSIVTHSFSSIRMPIVSKAGTMRMVS